MGGTTTVQTIFKFDVIKPRDVTTASLHVCKSQQFFNILFFWRTLAFILSLGACIGNATHQLAGLVDKQREFFLSFTNLCFLFLTIYFLVATLFSFADWRRKRYAYFVSVPGGNATTESLLFGSNTMEDDDSDPLDTETPSIYKIFWVMFEIAFTMSVYVDLIFWLMFKTTGSIDLVVVLLHGLNGLLMIGELFLNSMVFVPGHVIFIWVVLLCYLVEVWIWAAVDHVWAFSVLDVNHNGMLVFAYYPALFITATVTFFIGFFLVKIRDRKKQPRVYRNFLPDETFGF